MVVILSGVSSWLYTQLQALFFVSLSPLPRLSLQWQREGDLLGGDSKRGRRLALTSGRRGGRERGECSSTVHPGTPGYIYLFISTVFIFVLVLPLLVIMAALQEVTTWCLHKRLYVAVASHPEPALTATGRWQIT